MSGTEESEGSRDPVEREPAAGGPPPHHGAAERRGPIAWMARNGVAANLLLLVFMVGGLLAAPRVTREVFPSPELDVVTVFVSYPGASPEEVEQGVILAIEEAVRGIEGVKRVRSVADEGEALVNVELQLGTDRNQMLSEVESEVGRIASLPLDAERPLVSLATLRRQVLSLIYHGDVGENTLRELADRARDRLLEHPDITYVELSGVRPREISIEIPRDELRRHRLSLQEVAERVRQGSIDLPAGDLETKAGDVVLRTTERAESGREFERISLISTADGGRVTVGDVATVYDGFSDLNQVTYYDGELAVRIDVYRVGNEGPVEVAAAARAFVAEERARLPPTVDVAVWNDMSEVYEDRMSLLLRNGFIGLGLVLFILGLLLEPHLAFWVTLGIPVSFLGALLFLPATDVSINLISLFAFIVTLGLVVDDAIVVGESVYRRREQGLPLFQAAVTGAREVARPVIFSITTTCVAFAPMLFVPGVAGQFFRNIPIVVILVLLVSLAESLLVLPAHLSHAMPRLLAFVLRPFFWTMTLLRSDAVSAWLDRFVQRRYVPALDAALRYRYVTIATALVLLLGALGLQLGGRIGFEFMPAIEADQVTATVRMPAGTPFSVTEEIQQRLVVAARRVEREASPGIVRGVYSELGMISEMEQEGGTPAPAGSHVASVTANLVPAGERSIESREFADAWRSTVGELPSAESLVFHYTTGATQGPPITLQLSHEDEHVLRRAAGRLADELARYAGTRDVDDGYTEGRERIDFVLSPEGRALGLTNTWLAEEIRAAFFGAEVERFQRGRDEVRVYVRLPEDERRSIEQLKGLVLRLPGGGEAPLGRVADLHWGRSFTRIERTDMARTVNVTAYVSEDVTANEIVGAVLQDSLPALLDEYPGLRYAPGGDQEAQQESLGSLGTGFAIALLVMFALLSVAFRSYVQPAIVLAAIPFGMVGALFGHILFGYGLSLSSMFGIVALSGVVVNDSLLMVSAINDERSAGADAGRAVLEGATRRFRPIVMTTLTTFFGLSPMIVETSVQARFLIPMAIALGFGILFATGILVLLVPALYLAIEDVRKMLLGGRDRAGPGADTKSTGESTAE